jgi:hypothetical protein
VAPTLLRRPDNDLENSPNSAYHRGVAGRPRSSTRLLADSYSSVDVADVQVREALPGRAPADGILRRGSCVRAPTVDFEPWSGPNVQPRQYALLRFPTINGGPTGLFQVSITTTRVHRGGLRYWFMCPECGRRAKKLYPVHRVWPGHSESYGFGCRVCLELAYECQYVKPSRFEWERGLVSGLLSLQGQSSLTSGHLCRSRQR